jgi:hypothetical protein
MAQCSISVSRTDAQKSDLRAPAAQDGLQHRLRRVAVFGVGIPLSAVNGNQAV